MARINLASAEPEPLQSHIASRAFPEPIEARFTIGHDRMGRWIVKDRMGKVGGMFVNESAALCFARDEADHNPALVCRAREGQILELGLPSGIRALIR